MSFLDSDSPSPDQPQFQFRDPRVPGAWLHLLCENKITALEFSLAIVIDAYVKIGGEGCWASNKHLARSLGCTQRSIIRSLNRLEEIGCVVRYVKDNRRYLETVWSRVLEGGCPAGHPPRARPGTLIVVPTELQNKYKCRDRGAVAGGVTGANDKMAFFPNLTTQKKNPPSLEDFERTTQLHEAIVHSTTTIQKWSKSKWADEFRILRGELEQDEVRVQEVLDWFSDHIGKPYVPEAYSAYGFRKKFLQIESAMKRDKKKNPRVTPSQPALDIADRLGRKHWPKGSKDQIPIVAEVSLQNYTSFLSRVREALADLNEDEPGAARMGRFIEYLLGKLPSTTHFVESWLAEANRRVQGWESWSGDLTAFAYEMNHKDFQAHGRGLASRWGGSEGPWEKLMEGIHAGD